MGSTQTQRHAQAEARIHALCQCGDWEQAVTLTLRTYGPEVLGMLYVTVGHPTDADEVFSLFCEAVWRGLPGFEWRCSLRTWVYVLARRAGLGFKEQARRTLFRRGETLDSEIGNLVAMVRSTTTSQVRHQRQDLVDQLRKQLSQDEQLLLTLRVDRQMDWVDIARVFEPDAENLGRVAATLRKRFQRVKDHLRAQVPPSGS